jgi:hypothetical protein
MARRDPVGIRLLNRNGYDWSPRYPLIVEAVNMLKVRSCLIDGEAVACDDNGLAVFERLRQKRQGRHVFLYAFDLLGWQGPSTRTYRGTQGDAGQSLAVMRAGRASEPTPHTRRISIPRTEAHVIRHLHERMPYGLFVPDVVLE